MRRYLSLALVVTVIFNSLIRVRAQDSLGDVARRYRAEKENAVTHDVSGAQQIARPVGTSSEAGPVTKLQIFAWLAGGL
jgi:hypothetical protein